MENNDTKNLNLIFNFLNDLAKQLAEKIKDSGSQQNREMLLELNEMAEEFKRTLEAKGTQAPKIEMATSPVVSTIKQYKVEILPKIEIPPFPKFPEFPKIPEFPKEISIKQASEILSLLSSIIKEIQGKSFKVDLTAIERRIFDFQNRLIKEIEVLKDSIPRLPDLELPMEQERVKVILPDKQVAQMGGGGSGVSSVSIKGSTSIGDGTTTVTTAGVATQLPDQTCKRVFIQAHEDNTGTIVIGSSTVVAALVGRRGLALFATQGDWFNVSNLSLLYIDSTINGDKINYFYEK